MARSDDRRGHGGVGHRRQTRTRSCGAPPTTTRTRSSGAPRRPEDVVWVQLQRTALQRRELAHADLPSPGSFEYLRRSGRPPRSRRGARAPNALAWSALPFAARLYVAAVIIGGVVLMVKFFPTTIPHAPSFAALVALSCLTSAWKVNLPLHTEQRLDALGLLRGRSHGAPAARPAAGHGRRRGRRLDAVHVQRQAAVSAVSHHLQHGGRSDHDAGDRSRLPVAPRRAGAACTWRRCPRRSSA